MVVLNLAPLFKGKKKIKLHFQVHFFVFYGGLTLTAWINMKSIYVGNLPFAYNDAQLQELFAEFGEVKSAKIIMDKMTGRSKGFGFVEMDDDGAAMNAIESLNGKELNGRPVRVNESQPRENKPRTGFRGPRRF